MDGLLLLLEGAGAAAAAGGAAGAAAAAGSAVGPSPNASQPLSASPLAAGVAAGAACAAGAAAAACCGCTGACTSTNDAQPPSAAGAAARAGEACPAGAAAAAATGEPAPKGSQAGAAAAPGTAPGGADLADLGDETSSRSKGAAAGATAALTGAGTVALPVGVGALQQEAGAVGRCQAMQRTSHGCACAVHRRPSASMAPCSSALQCCPPLEAATHAAVELAAETLRSSCMAASPLLLCCTCSLGVLEPRTSARGRTAGSPDCSRGDERQVVEVAAERVQGGRPHSVVLSRRVGNRRGPCDCISLFTPRRHCCPSRPSSPR